MAKTSCTKAIMLLFHRSKSHHTYPFFGFARILYGTLQKVLLIEVNEEASGIIWYTLSASSAVLVVWK